jgi:hypothetical protein
LTDPPEQESQTATSTSTSTSKRWPNLLGGTIAAVAAAATLSFCTSQATVTSCTVVDGASTATISYQVKNRSPSSADYTVHFVVNDASGARVGAGAGEVTALAAGATANKTTDVDLDADGGKTCEIVDVT